MTSCTVVEMRIGSRTIRYAIRRSERARRMSLRLIPGRGLEVVLPRGYTPRDAAAFVRKEQAWVFRAFDRSSTAHPATLRNGSPLPYLDERLTLLLLPASQSRVTRTGNVITVTSADPDIVYQSLVAWYREEARRELTARARVHASTLGVELRRIAIKDTRSRWGSCSELGNLNFSWRLMLAPEAVMDYVVAHEVAHLRELNHSPLFWQHVERLCPDYRVQRRWLRANGAALAGWPDTSIPTT